MSLTPKQRRFVEEFLVDLNATQAAIRAGYSKKTARSIGSENLTKPDIALAIAVKLDGYTRKAGITVERVLEVIEAILFFDPREVVEWGPNGVKLKPRPRVRSLPATMLRSADQPRERWLHPASFAAHTSPIGCLDKTTRIMDVVLRNRRTAVKTCHSSSKTDTAARIAHHISHDNLSCRRSKRQSRSYHLDG